MFVNVVGNIQFTGLNNGELTLDQSSRLDITGSFNFPATNKIIVQAGNKNTILQSYYLTNISQEVRLTLKMMHHSRIQH